MSYERTLQAVEDALRGPTTAIDDSFPASSPERLRATARRVVAALDKLGVTWPEPDPETQSQLHPTPPTDTP